MGHRSRRLTGAAIAAAGLMVAVLALSSCQRDGFECANDTDCFDGEVCSSGRCEPGCVPEPDGELCASTGECGETISFTDRCGTTREVFCGCANNGNNLCPPDTDEQLCAELDAQCGSLTATDNCMDTRTIECGPCGDGETCVDNVCTCAPPVCPEVVGVCGTVTNECGESVACGTCSDTDVCIDNLCRPPVLSPDEVVAGDRFGEEIRYSDGLLAVGAPNADAAGIPNAGAIYVYRVNSDEYRLLDRLTAPNPQANDAFGRTFDMLEGRLVAGAGDQLLSFDINADDLFELTGNAELPGAVYDVNLRNRSEILIGVVGASIAVGRCSDSGCTIGTSWIPPNTNGDIGLGYQIDSAGGVALAGAPFADIPTPDNQPEPTGAFYWFADSNVAALFQMTNWPDGPELYRDRDYTDLVDRVPTVEAGWSVAISAEGFAAIGAPRTTSAQLILEAGMVFFFRPGTDLRWVLPERFVSPSDLSWSRCGHSVAIVGPNVFVACLFDGRRGDALTSSQELQTSGVILRYRLHPDLYWELIRGPLQADEPQLFDHFGWTLEGTADRLYIGAPGRRDDAGEVSIVVVE
jgi:hypothetical protein